MSECNALQTLKALVDAGCWDQAEALARQQLGLDVRVASIHYLLGLVLANTGRLADAAEAFARASQLQPGLLAAWLNQVTALQQFGQHTQAVAVLDRALAVHPQQPQLLLAAGHAVAVLQQALELEPANHHARFHLALALKDGQQLELALEQLVEPAQTPRRCWMSAVLKRAPSHRCIGNPRP